MRKAIIVAVGILIVFAGVKGCQMMGASKEQAKPKAIDNVTTVFTDEVQLSSVPVFVESTGVLEAVERLELFSEVQGIMLPDGGKFKEGVSFKKGEVLVAIKSSDVQAQLVARRSTFERMLTAVMPDLKLDYAADFSIWSTYLKNLSVTSSLPELPKVKNEQLKSFLTGNSIYSEYYNIKNAEINLAKFKIRAPYTGVLVEANVDPGTVIRQGQQLGVFIKPDQYELEVAISAGLVDMLANGKKAELALDKNFNETWEGQISRINRTVNTESQLSSVFVRTNSTQLKNGMFMHAKIFADEVKDAVEVSRSMLFDEDKVFLVKRDILVEKQVTIKHQSKNSAIVSGLDNRDVILTKIPPTAFAGMKVSIYQNAESK